MRKSYEILRIAVVMVLLLGVACVATPEAPAPPAPAGGGAPAAESGPIQIGAIFPLTGASQHDGNDEKRGAELAMEEINAIGGIGGRPLQIIFEDSESDPKAGVDAAHKLIDVDKVPVIVGVFSSGVTLPIAEYAQQQGVVVINPASTSPKLREVGDYLFSVMGLDDLMGTELAKFALETAEGKTASVLVPNNPFGIGMEEWMVKTWEEAGGEILDVVEYPLAQTDYRAEVERLFSQNPDVILYTAYGEESKIITKQTYELGYADAATWYGGYMTMTTGVADPETVEGHLGLEPGYTGPTAAHFRALYQEKYDMEPVGSFSAYAYDAVWLAALSMGFVGTDPAAIRDALPKVAPHYRAATGTIEFDADGQRAAQEYEKLEFTGEQLQPYQP